MNYKRRRISKVLEFTFNTRLVHMLLILALLVLNSQSSIVVAQGKLFIIGGGKRPPALIARMIKEADKVNYAMILPFASEEQDSSIFYARKQFDEAGIKVTGFMLTKGDAPSKSVIDSIANAGIIYIPGGDQVKFMEIVTNTGIMAAIRQSYKNGGLVGGTSAGAAVMSRKMITGVELKYKNTTEESEKDGFKTIEADNIEIKEGLGFLENCIIDQHFIKRKRMNRLIAVAAGNSKYLVIGIDESTALLVKNGVAEVVGESQVVTLTSTDKPTIVNGKFGIKDMKLSVYVPGNTFTVK